VRCRLRDRIPDIADVAEELLDVEDARQGVDVSQHIVVVQDVVLVPERDRAIQRQLDVRGRHVVLTDLVEEVCRRREAASVDLRDARGPLAVLLQIDAEDAGRPRV
jgi:hypothetical protein